MKSRLITGLVILLLLLCGRVSAQQFEVPAVQIYNKGEDYKEYESKILECINWLEQTPLGEQEEKRQKANAFLLKWIEGSPDVTITVFGNVIKWADKNPDLLVLFMAGWTKYSIGHSYTRDSVKGSVAGLQAVIEYCKKGNGVKKNSELAKVFKADEQGKLEEWVKEAIAKEKK